MSEQRSNSGYTINSEAILPENLNHLALHKEKGKF